MKRRLISIMLVIGMVLSVVPATVFAAESDNGAEAPLNYVSLGDSMSNGYGLPGYDGNTGVEDYGEGAYANQFAEYYGFNHAQLAMSAMRAEDLHRHC